MSQHVPRPGEEVLPFPDFHEEVDLFGADEAEERYPHRRRMLVIVSILLLILLSGSILVVVKRWPHIIYQAQSVTQGDLVLTTNASGPLHTNVYSINFTTTGKLTEIDIKVGQRVKKDQILAKLDATTLQNALNEAQANVDTAQATLDNAKANYDATLSATTANVNAAQAALDKARSSAIAIPATGSANNDINLLKLQLANAQAQQTIQNAAAQGLVNTAQASLTMAQTQLATAKSNLRSVVLNAPHDGTIAAINGAVGSLPGTPFIQVVDLSSVQVQANVDESAINSVAIGDAVKFSLDAYSDQSFEGKVAAISPLGQSTSNITTYPVMIDIVTELSDNMQLFPGMTARATITTDERPDALLVPVSALNFARAAVKARSETDNHSLISRYQVDKVLDQANDMLQNLQQDVSKEQPATAFVLERNGQGKVVVKPIVTGLTDGKVYEVLDGLSTDDMVLVSTRIGND